jgi:hypothetical protein
MGELDRATRVVVELGHIGAKPSPGRHDLEG